MKKKLVLSLLLVLFISLYSCVDAKVKIEFELAKDEKVVGEMRNAKVNDSLAYVLENVTCEKEGYEFLDAYFVSLQQRINGLNHLFGEQAQVLRLMEILEAARYETDLKNYRKAVLDACSLIDEIEEGDSDV